MGSTVTSSTDPTAPASGRRHGGKDARERLVFLALTFIVVIIVALLSPDITTALLVVGALGVFVFAYISAGREQPAATADPLSPVSAKEGFSVAPYPVYADDTPAYDGRNVDDPDGEIDSSWPGAIDVDEHDGDAAMGHRDRRVGDNARMAEGNPYNRGRVDSPNASRADLDDEANDAEMDADELGAVQGRSRNDADRVAAGTANRRKTVDKYFRDELMQSENRTWWGRHEE